MNVGVFLGLLAWLRTSPIESLFQSLLSNASLKVQSDENKGGSKVLSFASSFFTD